MKKHIPKNMVKVDNRIVVTVGTSLAVTIPSTIAKLLGVVKGDAVSIYSNGKGLVMYNLKPEEE